MQRNKDEKDTREVSGKRTQVMCRRCHAVECVGRYCDECRKLTGIKR